MTVEQAKEAKGLLKAIQDVDEILHGYPTGTHKIPYQGVHIEPIVMDNTGRTFIRSDKRIEIPIEILSLSKLKDILLDYKNSLTDKLSKM